MQLLGPAAEICAFYLPLLLSASLAAFLLCAKRTARLFIFSGLCVTPGVIAYGIFQWKRIGAVNFPETFPLWLLGLPLFFFLARRKVRGKSWQGIFWLRAPFRTLWLVLAALALGGIALRAFTLPAPNQPAMLGLPAAMVLLALAAARIIRPASGQAGSDRPNAGEMFLAAFALLETLVYASLGELPAGPSSLLPATPGRFPPEALWALAGLIITAALGLLFKARPGKREQIGHGVSSFALSYGIYLPVYRAGAAVFFVFLQQNSVTSEYYILLNTTLRSLWLAPALVLPLMLVFYRRFKKNT